MIDLKPDGKYSSVNLLLIVLFVTHLNLSDNWENWCVHIYKVFYKKRLLCYLNKNVLKSQAWPTGLPSIFTIIVWSMIWCFTSCLSTQFRHHRWAKRNERSRHRTPWLVRPCQGCRKVSCLLTCYRRDDTSYFFKHRFRYLWADKITSIWHCP